jgi:hypothetical protein
LTRCFLALCFQLCLFCLFFPHGLLADAFLALQFQLRLLCLFPLDGLVAGSFLSKELGFFLFLAGGGQSGSLVLCRLLGAGSLCAEQLLACCFTLCGGHQLGALQVFRELRFPFDARLIECHAVMGRLFKRRLGDFAGRALGWRVIEVRRGPLRHGGNRKRCDGLPARGHDGLDGSCGRRGRCRLGHGRWRRKGGNRHG